MKKGTKIQAASKEIIEVVSDEFWEEGFAMVNVKLPDGSVDKISVIDLTFFIEKQGAKII